MQSAGDGIFALFGAFIAHKDHPQRALCAALRMPDDVRAARSRACGKPRGTGRRNRVNARISVRVELAL